MNANIKEPMVEMFILENSQLVKLVEESLEESIKTGSFEQYSDEIFRMMHVIRGNSSMMLYDNISLLAHHIECIFAYLKNNKPENICFAKIVELVSESLVFIKSEVNIIDLGGDPDGDPKEIIKRIEDYLINLNGGGNDILWKSTDIVEQSSKQRFYIKSSQDTGHALNESHLVKELNLKGTSSQKEKLNVNKKENKNVEEDSLQIHKDIIFISAERFKTLMELINELDKSEIETDFNNESGELPISFYYKLTQRRRKIIKDLQDITLSICIGL